MCEKVYAGVRGPSGPAVYRCAGRACEPLAWPATWPELRGYWFDWGRAGGSNGQLAFALLLDATANRALTVHLAPQFERRVVAELPRERFELSARAVRAWIAAHDKENLDVFVTDLERVHAAELGQAAADAAELLAGA